MSIYMYIYIYTYNYTCIYIYTYIYIYAINTSRWYVRSCVRIVYFWVGITTEESWSSINLWESTKM